MPSENIRNVYHDWVPITPTVVYSVPSGYQALVKPVRAYNASVATTVRLNLYQGSGITRRTVFGVDVDPQGLVVDDSPIAVASGNPLFASQNVASSITMHITAIERPA